MSAKVVKLAKPAQSSDEKLSSAYLDLEPDLRDLQRAVQIAGLMLDDTVNNDGDGEASGRLRLAVEYAERAADELVEKWYAKHKAATKG